jgi:hypothetical protein
MEKYPAFTNIDGLAYFARLRARQRVYNGKFGLMAQRVIEHCTHKLNLGSDRMALVTYVRETGEQACGWWAQPGLKRCRRLSVVFRNSRTGAILPHDRQASLAIAQAMFAAQIELVWCETPADSQCKPAGFWHYRLFCDARGRAAPLQQSTFTRENAGAAWITWNRLNSQLSKKIAA